LALHPLSRALASDDTAHAPCPTDEFNTDDDDQRHRNDLEPASLADGERDRKAAFFSRSVSASLPTREGKRVGRRRSSVLRQKRPRDVESLALE
jgi:hypothetical protein